MFQLTRMHDTLRKFDETKLKQWHEKLNGHYSLATVNVSFLFFRLFIYKELKLTLFFQLIGHLQSMLHTAYAKYDSWSQKKINLDQK